jgi:hypothetical protein
MNEIVTSISNEFTLTRYLYDVNKVIISLHNSIIMRNYDESCFWAYELYFSGFDCTVFEILEKTSISLYTKNHPKLIRFVVKKCASVVHNDESIAILIANITMKNPEIKESEKTKFISLRHDSIKQYLTKEPMELDKKNHQFLVQVCKYRVMGNLSFEELNIFRNDWISPASKSKVWARRIIGYNGIINENGSVLFTNEDDEEAFNDRYNYEVEEQSVIIENNCLGVTPLQ